MSITKNKKLLAGAAALVLTLTSLSFANGFQRLRWTSPGSCGTPDTYDQNDFRRSGGWMQMTSNSDSYMKVYYPVNAQSIYNPDYIALRARFRDNGSNERVIVYLREVRLDTGLVQTRLWADSNTRPASNSGQLMSDSEGSPGWGFENPNSVFYIEARFYKYGSTSPRLESLSVSGDLS